MVTAFFNEILGDLGRYDFIAYIFGAAFALYIADNLVKFLFSIISNLFKKGR